MGGSRHGISGAAWVFTRSGGVWSQQGASWSAPAWLELPTRRLGRAVRDGNTAIVGGRNDNSTLVRRGSSPAAAVVWSQQGESWSAAAHWGCPSRRLGRAVRRRQHRHRGRASDDNANTGAAWVYTRSGGVWTQQGGKLVGTGAVGQTRLLGRRSPATATRLLWAGPR